MAITLSNPATRWSGSWQTRLSFWTLMALAMQAATTKAQIPITAHVSDKFQHGAAFAALTMLALLAWPRVSRLRLAERMALFGAMIELVQDMPMIGRDCDIRDWVADMVGVVLAIGFARLVQSR